MYSGIQRIPCIGKGFAPHLSWICIFWLDDVFVQACLFGAFSCTADDGLIRCD
jgi:hypothetical protein